MDVSSALVVAALGVTFGWQPANDDPRAYEVTAQIEPELLDAIKAGRNVPIESHVPADVNPIRNIRVVVGKGDLPRIALKPVAKSDRIVRGQGDVPQNHTSLLANDDGWSTTQYSAGNAAGGNDSRRYEQRNATIGADSARTALAPPPLDRAATAATEAGSFLRDGVEAGIQQANQQASQVGGRIVEGANDLGRGFNQGLQDLSNTAQGQLKGVWPAPPPSAAANATDSTMRTAAAATTPPPNLPAFSSQPTATASSGWSSIRAEFPPPALLMPPLTNVPAASAPAHGNASSFAGNAGPSFPSANQSSTPFHSVLVDPTTPAGPPMASGQSPASNGSLPNSGSFWGTFPGDSSPTLPLRNGPQVPTAAATDNRYAQQPGAGTTPDPWADWGKMPLATNNPASIPSQPSGPMQQQVSSSPNVPPSNSPPAGSPQFIGFANGNAANAVQPATAAASDVPWKPLLAVSLALAGSIGANLFLGWSYADARHRYRALVRKTTNSFQRAAGAAA